MKSFNGKIVTFYSFKGGVGRTMALANVAYLCATSGLKVLVMDWDLEAPGLAYYFRGLMDAHEARSLKDTPGILDILWNWTNSLEKAKGAKDTKEVIDTFEIGIPFQDVVKPINQEHFSQFGGKLDFIGAGAKIVNSLQPEPYEEALARFSWTSFFEIQAGGIPLEMLRKWAKKNYDIIFLDSRTGLADVASICTMQLPDLVGLCFILNRQNIDGVAKVAGAIRIKRNDEIPVMAIPMRVTRSDTAEESDARARAATELKRIGQFSTEAISDDFKQNTIMASESIPFYETLAPFSATSAKHDPLSLNYLQLTDAILKRLSIEKPTNIPQFDPEFLELAKRRLQPRYATVDYIQKLRTSEPARAISELGRLLGGALETEVDGGGLDDDYILALAEATMTAGEYAENPFDAISLQLQALDILRTKASASPKKWNNVLIFNLERALDEFSYLHNEENELALLEEVDALLAENFTISNWLKRIKRRRQTARIYLNTHNLEATMQTIGEVNTQLKDIQRAELAADQLSELISAEIDVTLIRGEVLLLRNNLDLAYDEFRRGIYLASTIDLSNTRSEVSRLRSELHYKLATAPANIISADVAAENAIQSVKWGQAYSWLANFESLAKVVLQSKNIEKIVQFAQSTLMPGDIASYRGMVSSYFSRQVKLAISFFEVQESILIELQSAKLEEERLSPIFNSSAMISDTVLKGLLRRRQTIGERSVIEITDSIVRLIPLYQSEGVNHIFITELIETVNKLSNLPRSKYSQLISSKPNE